MAEILEPGDQVTGNDVVDLYYKRNGERIERVYWDDRSALSELELRFIAILYIDAEIGNGGIEQAITNPGGDVLPFTRASLNRIGATDAVGILDEVISKVPADTDWADQDEREDAFYEAFGDQADLLDELDDRWIDARDNTYDALAKYILNTAASARPN